MHPHWEYAIMGFLGQPSTCKIKWFGVEFERKRVQPNLLNFEPGKKKQKKKKLHVLSEKQ